MDVLELGENSIEYLIVITGAEHLNSTRDFISDIYNETYQLDGNLSEDINDQEFVRITFEKNLTRGRRIDIYGYTSDTIDLELYANNGSEYGTVSR